MTMAGSILPGWVAATCVITGVGATGGAESTGVTSKPVNCAFVRSQTFHAPSRKDDIARFMPLRDAAGWASEMSGKPLPSSKLGGAPSRVACQIASNPSLSGAV